MVEGIEHYEIEMKMREDIFTLGYIKTTIQMDSDERESQIFYSYEDFDRFYRIREKYVQLRSDLILSENIKQRRQIAKKLGLDLIFRNLDPEYKKVAFEYLYEKQNVGIETEQMLIEMLSKQLGNEQTLSIDIFQQSYN